ncbi:hypothetical protein Tco_0833911 [Tanacetum coccineum]
MIRDDQGGADEHNVSQESGFVKEEEDAHVTLTTVHDSQKTDGPMQRSSVSSDFTSKLLNLENISSVDNEIASLMDTTVHHAEPSNFSFVFKFNERVTNLEHELSEMKQVDQYAQALSSILAIVDRYIDNKLGEAVKKTIQEEVKTQLPQILPKAVSDFATPVIETNVTESLEAVVLAKSSSQPKSTYEAAASLLEFELTKILIDKMEESKSHLRAEYKKELYDALSAHAEEQKVIQLIESVLLTNQEFDMGHTDDQLDIEAAPKRDYFKKPE